MGYVPGLKQNKKRITEEHKQSKYGQKAVSVNVLAPNTRKQGGFACYLLEVARDILFVLANHRTVNKVNVQVCELLIHVHVTFSL